MTGDARHDYVLGDITVDRHPVIPAAAVPRASGRLNFLSSEAINDSLKISIRQRRCVYKAGHTGCSGCSYLYAPRKQSDDIPVYTAPVSFPQAITPTVRLTWTSAPPLYHRTRKPQEARNRRIPPWLFPCVLHLDECRFRAYITLTTRLPGGGIQV